MKTRVFFLLSFISLLFISCNENLVYDQTKKVDESGWHMNDKLYFDVEIKDTLRLYDFAINLRNTTDYPNSNIYFFIKTTYPDGSITRCDTVECYLAYPDGTWTGKGQGKIKDNRFWFTKNVIFPQKGKYTFEIQQATRDTLLVGIKNVGLHIEYRNNYGSSK